MADRETEGILERAAPIAELLVRVIDNATKKSGAAPPLPIILGALRLVRNLQLKRVGAEGRRQFEEIERRIDGATIGASSSLILPG